MTKRQLRYCDLCHGDIEPGQRGPLCGACADWEDYWNGLTEAEREDEYAMMDAYVQQHAGEPG